MEHLGIIQWVLTVQRVADRHRPLIRSGLDLWLRSDGENLLADGSVAGT